MTTMTVDIFAYVAEMSDPIADDDPIVACACGEVTGERCQWSGPRAETVVIEWMPEYLRASHEAAGNSGSYPANGSLRLRVERSCADLLIEQDGDWTSIVAD